VRSISANYSYVFQSPPPDAVNSVAIVFSCPLNAEEIDVRLGFGLIEQEGGTACADFDVDETSASENLHKIDFAIQIFGF